MKKFLLIFTAVLLIAISAKTFAQSTGTIPQIGKIHSYEVTKTTGNTYSWIVTKGNFSTPAGAEIAMFSDAGTTSYTPGTVTTDLNKVYVRWVNPTVGTTYYVQVLETNSTGCTNRKVIAVQPTNAFEMDIVALNSSYAAQAIGTVPDYCAAPVTITAWNKTNATAAADAQDFNYDYNVTYLYYRVEAKGIDYATTSWKPSLQSVLTNGTNSTVTSTWGTAVPTGAGPQGTYTTFGLNTTSATEITVPAGNQYIYIEVAVDNKETNTTGNEGTTAQAVQLLLTGRDGNNNSVTQINGTVATANDNAKDNVLARPATTVITTN